MKIKKNLLFPVLATMIFIDPCHAVRVNGHEVTITKDDASLSYSQPKLPQSSNIIIRIQEEDLTIGHVPEPNLLPQICKMYEEINAQKHLLTQISSKSLEVSAKEIKFINVWAPRLEALTLKAEADISFETTLTKVTSASHFTGAELNFSRCFIPGSAKLLFTAPEGINHWLKGLEFTPATQDVLPFGYFLQGNIQFSPPHTTNPFIIFGAKEVIVKFKKT